MITLLQFIELRRNEEMDDVTMNALESCGIHPHNVDKVFSYVQGYSLVRLRNGKYMTVHEEEEFFEDTLYEMETTMYSLLKESGLLED